MGKPLFVFFLTVLFSSGDVFSQGRNIQDSKLEIIAKNLDTPWAIDFLPDNTLIFTERKGNVKIVSGSEVRTVGKIGVSEVMEAGLCGIAVDPQFEQNRFIYLYYAYRPDGSIINRVSRFVLRDSLTNEVVLLDNIPGSRIHNGGRIRFGPDGFLYITTGDAGEQEISEDIGSLGGKVLRMRKDGSVPGDNPFTNYVYAYGLRNPQGLAWHEGVFYVTDHGPRRYDEVNIVEKGNSYGWPRTCDIFPAFKCFTDFTLAPAACGASGGFLFVTGLRGNQIRRINLTDGTEEEYFTDLGRLRALTIRDSYLYFSTSNRDGRGRPQAEDDKIYRVPIDQMIR